MHWRRTRIRSEFIEKRVFFFVRLQNIHFERVWKAAFWCCISHCFFLFVLYAKKLLLMGTQWMARINKRKLKEWTQVISLVKQFKCGPNFYTISFKVNTHTYTIHTWFYLDFTNKCLTVNDKLYPVRGNFDLNLKKN